MTSGKKIALTTAFLLLTGLLHSQTLSVINGDTVICITVKQMDIISGKLIACKELPGLQELIKAKNAELGACNDVVKKDAELIGKYQEQIAQYVQISQVKEEEKNALSDLLKVQKKQVRRVKLMTGFIVAPVSFVLGGILALIIVR